VADDGRYFDFADKSKGDFIHLISEMHKVSPTKAAELIVKASGGIVSDFTPAPAQPPKAEKPRAVYPVPADKVKLLKILIDSDFSLEKHGTPVAGWKYHDEKGRVIFCVARFNKPDGSKDVIPYYWDGIKWREGQPMKDGRPLFNLHHIAEATPATKILIVEGEKCASVKIPGWILTTWSSGCASVDKTDFSPLIEAARRGVVFIWPDADYKKDKSEVFFTWDKQPGMVAGLHIVRKLPGAVLLNTSKYAEQKDGWDIADAIGEGIDPAKFIAECPTVSQEQPDLSAPLEDHDTEQDTPDLPPSDYDSDRPEDIVGQPFRCLGYDAESYHFLQGGQQQEVTIRKGAFTTSMLQELTGSLAWWAIQGAVNKNGGIDLPHAQELIMEMQAKAGLFDPEYLRGSGVWIDRGEIIINDGGQIITLDGHSIPLEGYAGQAAYLRSKVNFLPMQGDDSTADEGRRLQELFDAQGFSRPLESVAALGWSLIAPFGGILSWRPHLWLSGRKGTGKTYVLENLVKPICGPFAHCGSGKDTEAGIRRTLNMDARPVILDEMEPKSRPAKENVSKILDLARNAAGDGSGRVTMASGTGTQTFLIRSCFAFASINMPEEGAAIASRIISVELSPPKNEDRKIAESKRLYGPAMKEPARYLRRIFHALPRIMQDIEYLRDTLTPILDGRRDADLWAPILSAAWAIQSNETIQTADGMEWLMPLVDARYKQKGETVEDEDRVVEHILAASMMTDEKTSRTIAELLNDSALHIFDGQESGRLATEILSRVGIRLFRPSDPIAEGEKRIGICTRSDAISELLADTPYSSGYDAQIKRNPICRNYTGGGLQVRFSLGRRTARLLGWDQFAERYL